MRGIDETSDLITASPPVEAASSHGNDNPDGRSSGSTQPERTERSIQMRRPLLEVPPFAGFNAFWSVSSP
ncbi:hypothetical protein Y032_0009g759 [Ancylostoma ceylanicum]|nr:hypothetical protein Y032_0009g759 [Ancylostoma ceylanicum]